MNILVTGAAGFIGYHLVRRLAGEGHAVTGIDNMNDYYDPELKRARLRELERGGVPADRIVVADTSDLQAMQRVFAAHRFHTVVHLAAQAGVRYSIDHPFAYINSNLTGFANMLECCRHRGVQHLIYASSSSVYGANVKMPFSERDNVDHPISLYAATKKSNELMAHAYSNLYGLPTTGLRLFTVYGPWGRPDMAYFSFAQRILSGEPIRVFNRGDMKRDFTYIDDIVEGIVRLLDRIPAAEPSWDRLNPDPATSFAPYRVYNIGNHRSTELMHMIRVLEELLGRKAVMELLPMQPGDVRETFADIAALNEATGFRPSTPIETGLERFVAWYRSYYNV